MKFWRKMNLSSLIVLQNFDAVVGDVTILASRSTYVDFTLPFFESDVKMVVLTKRDERENMWIFLTPLSLELWLTTVIAFILTGLVVWVLEHRENKVFRGKPVQQLGTTLWFSFSTLVFAHSNFSFDLNTLIFPFIDFLTTASKFMLL